MNKVEKIIKRTPLEGKIPKQYLKEIKILDLESGDYLYYSEKTFNSIFFIVDGLVQFKQITHEGIEINYGFLEKFYFLGERKLLFNDRIMIDFYILRDNTKILEIPIKIAETLLKDKNFKIYLLELHSKKLHKLVTDISILHFMGMNRFFAYNLLRYSVNGVFKFKNITFLSSIFSMDRKSVYNAISRLEKEKIIKREKNIISILDFKKLEGYIKL